MDEPGMVFQVILTELATIQEANKTSSVIQMRCFKTLKESNNIERIRVINGRERRCMADVWRIPGQRLLAGYVAFRPQFPLSIRDLRAQGAFA